MTVISFWFFLMLAAGVLIYYLVPQKGQWFVLLVLSIVYYCLAAVPYTIIFLIGSTLIAYSATRRIERERESAAEGREKKIAAVAVAAVAANALIWFLLKGSAFWTDTASALHNRNPAFPVLSALPVAAALGMGYYTAQVIAYILDVYWQISKAQRNPVKLFLFIAFFPQLTVGPISRYHELETLYKGHRFSYENLCFGSQRILWGLFKKLVIADRVGILTNAIWSAPESCTGFWPWIALLLYPLQIYADFSGCMDIVLGAAELFDIRLPENFNNPFFARSSQEFWQRWHITLGTWARDYVYYPVLKSRFLTGLGKRTRKRFGRRVGKLIPWGIGMAILWFVMGFWHGSMRFIFGVSLWYWLMLVLAELTKPLSDRIKAKLRVKTESFGWHLFQSMRTYLIYAVGAMFFSAGKLSEAFIRLRMLLQSFRALNPWIFFDRSILTLGFTWEDVNLILVGVVILFVAAGLREKRGYARTWIREQSVGFRWAVWIVLLLLVMVYGLYGPGYDASSFIYQGF